MLKQLHIENLILISLATIPFENGFNVLSGETGAGKSAIIKALHLLTGSKADLSVIRHGADKAIVEGLFDIDNYPKLIRLLEDANIDHSHGEELIIRREISLSGKGRCSINNQTAQLALLKKICSFLFEMVGQHANQKLLSLDQHRNILDLYGDNIKQAAVFAHSWESENLLSAELDDLIKNEAQRLREIERCRQELDELEEAALKEGEEEELFAEYSRLSNADEIASTLQEAIQTLNGERSSLLSSLKRNSHSLELLAKLDPSFDECAQAHRNALMELQEVSYTLEKFSGRVEINPHRLQEIDARLSLISKLKKKYGSTIDEIQSYAELQQQKLQTLESADVRIEEGKAELETLRKQNDALAASLTEKRKKDASVLAKELTKELHELNMPKARFDVEVIQRPRTATGNDEVEFFLTPNVGEKQIPIREHASGGELSRILLAMQTLLAGKESVATLVFDEIDANIGGATAVVIGEKLQKIGLRHQVLCITHFPQVAKQASHHLQINKQEIEGRTFSQIIRLDSKKRRHELDRMSGLVK